MHVCMYDVCMHVMSEEENKISKFNIWLGKGQKKDNIKSLLKIEFKTQFQNKQLWGEGVDWTNSTNTKTLPNHCILPLHNFNLTTMLTRQPIRAQQKTSSTHKGICGASGTGMEQRQGYRGRRQSNNGKLFI